MSTAPVITLEIIRQNVLDSIEKLRACAASPAGEDTVLAWETGLGVKFSGQALVPSVVQLDAATALTNVTRRRKVYNGAHHRAYPVKRSEAIGKYVEWLLKHLSEMEG